MVEILPVSDPNAATMAQKVVQYQAVLQMAEQAPHIYNIPLLHRQMLDTLGIKNFEKLVPMEEDDQIPRDPVTENMNVMQSKPVKAFMFQDHESHIIVHGSMLQDPKIQEVLGQNPKAQVMLAAMNAHLAEHLAFEYRRQIEEQAGVPYPAPEHEIPADMEVEISRLAAAAAQQLLQKNQSEKAQQEAQKAAEDPVMQMAQKELGMKEKEGATKEKKVMIDAALAADKQALEEKKLASHEKIEGLKIGAQLATAKEQATANAQRDKMLMAADLVKAASQEAQQETQQADQQKQQQHTQQMDGLRTGIDIAKERNRQEEAKAQQKSSGGQQKEKPKPKDK